MTIVDQPDQPKFRVAPRWNARRGPGSHLQLAQSSAAVLKELLGAPRADRLTFLTDTRAVHQRMFRALTPEGFEAYAGTYRGEPLTSLEHRFAVVRYRGPRGRLTETRLVHPAKVASKMDRLAGYIVETFSRDWDAEGILWRCVHIFREFSHIHPYLDGNGQISRILMHVMAETSGIAVSSNWTSHVRPYDGAIGYALQCYPRHPELLVGYLKRWFGRWAAG